MGVQWCRYSSGKYLLKDYVFVILFSLSLSLSLSVPGYPYAGSSMPVYYDGVSAGGPGMFYPPYNGPVMYNPPLLSVDDRTLQEYIRKQMYVCS